MVSLTPMLSTPGGTEPFRKSTAKFDDENFTLARLSSSDPIAKFWLENPA